MKGSKTFLSGWVHGVVGGGIDGHRLESNRELQVKILDVQHQIRHQQQGCDDDALRKAPARALGFFLIVVGGSLTVEVHVHRPVVLEARRTIYKLPRSSLNFALPLNGA